MSTKVLIFLLGLVSLGFLYEANSINLGVTVFIAILVMALLVVDKRKQSALPRNPRIAAALKNTGVLLAVTAVLINFYNGYL